MTSATAVRFLLLLALSASRHASAAVDCNNANNQRDMNACAAEAFKLEDQRLNKLYKELVGRSDKSEIAKLKQIQLAWIKFRDLHCAYEQQRYEGGSMAPMVRTNCLRDLTKQRNDTLQAVIKDFH